MGTSKQKAFLLAVAEAVHKKHPLPLHPNPEIRDTIKRAGGVAEWIKQDRTRRHQFTIACIKVSESGKTKRGKIKVPLKERIGGLPRSLRPKVKGLKRRPRGGGDTLEPPQLSAGMPGNEETDPGPRMRQR